MLAILIVSGVVMLPRILDRAQDERDDVAICISYLIALVSSSLGFENTEAIDQIIAIR